MISYETILDNGNKVSVKLSDKSKRIAITDPSDKVIEYLYIHKSGKDISLDVGGAETDDLH